MAETAARVAQSFVERAGKREIDLTKLQSDVDQLADRAVIDSFDASQESITIRPDGSFVGEGTVYLLLEYKGNVTVGEELIVNFNGLVDEAGHVIFRDLHADMSPFETEAI